MGGHLDLFHQGEVCPRRHGRDSGALAEVGGGPKSRLGYPTGDETYTSNHHGRRSEFQYGEIIWYPNKGAYARYSKTREPEKKPGKDDRPNLK
jgi:uncharacterized protein with LGFP repeats